MISRYKSEKGGRAILASYDRLVAAWGVPVAEEDVETPFGRTHLLISGDASNPPLVLFHGVGDDSALMWRFNAQGLSGFFRLIAVDTIGGPGRSEPNETYSRCFDAVRWIDAILDAKGLDRVLIAGVSNGAYLAQLYAARRPERVRKAFCMAGSLAVKGGRNPIFRMLPVFLPEALFPTEKNAVRLMRKLMGRPDAVLQDPEVMAHWLLLLKHFNNRSMMYHRYVGFDEAEIDAIRTRTRFLIGECDPLADGPEAREALKSHRMDHAFVSDAGHAINHEQPERVLHEMVAHLLG